MARSAAPQQLGRVRPVQAMGLPVALPAMAQGGLALALLAQTGAAAAAESVTSPQRWIAVETASVRAESLLHQLARVAVPLCGERAAWGLGPPRQHLWRPPAASGFARADDLDRVPVRDEGRARYAHCLTLPSPKAFFILGQGGWRLHADAPDALQQGLDHCASRGLDCALYAVDDNVVWQADPAQRTTRLSQLQPAALPPAAHGGGR